MDSDSDSDISATPPRDLKPSSSPQPPQSLSLRSLFSSYKPRTTASSSRAKLISQPKRRSSKSDAKPKLSDPTPPDDPLSIFSPALPFQIRSRSSDQDRAISVHSLETLPVDFFSKSVSSFLKFCGASLNFDPIEDDPFPSSPLILQPKVEIGGGSDCLATDRLPEEFRDEEVVSSRCSQKAMRRCRLRNCGNVAVNRKRKFMNKGRQGNSNYLGGRRFYKRKKKNLRAEGGEETHLNQKQEGKKANFNGDLIEEAIQAAKSEPSNDNLGKLLSPRWLRASLLKAKLNVDCFLAMTATVTTTTLNAVMSALEIPSSNLIQKSKLRENFQLSISLSRNRMKDLLSVIKSSPFVEVQSIIIYCKFQSETDLLSRYLCDYNVPAKSYHSDNPAKDHSCIQESFCTNKIRLVVAAVAFGMGLDKRDVSAWHLLLFIHYSLPETLEERFDELAGMGDRPIVIFFWMMRHISSFLLLCSCIQIIYSVIFYIRFLSFKVDLQYLDFSDTVDQYAVDKFICQVFAGEKNSQGKICSLVKESASCKFDMKEEVMFTLLTQRELGDVQYGVYLTCSLCFHMKQIIKLFIIKVIKKKKKYIYIYIYRKIDLSHLMMDMFVCIGCKHPCCIKLADFGASKKVVELVWLPVFNQGNKMIFFVHVFANPYTKTLEFSVNMKLASNHVEVRPCIYLVSGLFLSLWICLHICSRLYKLLVIDT
ncbi:hypothetical protein UlMin_039890 [Ulmus minor]